jgi:hypothetical protein
VELQVRLRSEQEVQEGKLTTDLEKAEFQKVFDEIDSGKKPCGPEVRSWFEGCLGTDKVCSGLEAIQKAEIMKAFSNSKLMEKVLPQDYYSNNVGKTCWVDVLLALLTWAFYFISWCAVQARRTIEDDKALLSQVRSPLGLCYSEAGPAGCCIVMRHDPHIWIMQPEP